MTYEWYVDQQLEGTGTRFEWGESEEGQFQLMLRIIDSQGAEDSETLWISVDSEAEDCPM